MICTIGSLVQETSHRIRWLMTTSLYTLACICTSVLLGVVLSSVGLFIRQINCSTPICSSVQNQSTGTALITVLAMAYAFSDAGLIRLPRPTVMFAVPLTWWRWWKPYGAAMAYGATLGLGVTTYIQFGSFYVLCLWCIFKGNIVYGAMLMGTYGIARSLVMFPASLIVYSRDAKKSSARHLDSIASFLGKARLIVAVTLVLFAVQVMVQPH